MLYPTFALTLLFLLSLPLLLLPLASSSSSSSSSITIRDSSRSTYKESIQALEKEDFIGLIQEVSTPINKDSVPTDIDSTSITRSNYILHDASDADADDDDNGRSHRFLAEPVSTRIRPVRSEPTNSTTESPAGYHNKLRSATPATDSWAWIIFSRTFLSEGEGKLELTYPRFWPNAGLASTSVELSSWRTIAGIICGAAAACLSSAGGVGGGGLYVPIFNLLLGFDSKTSAALSSCMILGGIIVNIIWYSFQKKPRNPEHDDGNANANANANANDDGNGNGNGNDDDGNGNDNDDKPLIDYRIALLFLPNVLLGISGGVICNVMSPGWLVTAILIVVLFLMTFRSCRSAALRWQKESDIINNNVRKIQIPRNKNNDDLVGDLHIHQNGHSYAHNGLKSQQPSSSPLYNGDDNETKKDLEQPLLEPPTPTKTKNNKKKKHPQFPPFEMTMLTVIWVAFLALQLLRGSSDGQNLFGIEQCGTAYWIITSSQVPIAITVTLVTILYLRKLALEESSAHTKEEDFEEPSDDLRRYVVDVKSMVVTSAFALGAGFLGGMLGLGGGTIISPLLIEMGMHPQVTAATCSYVVFFSSSLSVVQYWLLGRIPELYALVSAALALVFSVIGLHLVQTFIIRYKRVSLIVFSVSTVMGISALLMAGFGSWDAWVQLKEGDYMGFEMPC